MPAHDPADTIAFQGVEGANADLACRQAYPYLQTLACPTFDDVFEAVSEGRARLGMLPFENTQAGRVAEIHPLLPNTNLHIVGEVLQRIEHHLVGVKGATLEGVGEVYSHPQALMQCRESLRKLRQAHGGYVAHGYSNTAAAAVDVAKWNNPSKAAIASRLAAELYGLTVLKSGIEDSKDNHTVFIVLAREPHDLDPVADGERVITTLIFQVRNLPGALYKALGGFATNGVNVIKLESYIPPGSDGGQGAQFLLQFEGNPADRNVQLALEELGFFTKRLRVFGVYKADAKRFRKE